MHEHENVDNKSLRAEECSYEEVLTRIGFGKVQMIILLVSGIILMAVINETMGMMIITMVSQCDLGTNSQKKALLNGASFLGIFLSSHTWGFLADRLGRRKVIMYTVFASNIFSLASCFVSNFWVFLVLRLLCGVGISGPSACLYAYLGEFNSNRYRPVVINYASMFVGIATTYIPAVAWLILSNVDFFIPLYPGYDLRPWRLILIAYLLPGFIGAICLSMLPETPRFLLSQGRDEEAMKVVRWIYTKNTGNDEDSFEVKRLASEQQVAVKPKDVECVEDVKKSSSILKQIISQTLPLFKPPHLFHFTLCTVVMFGAFFTSAGMGLWYAEIQNSVSEYADSRLTVCGVIASKSNSTAIAADSETAATICDDSVNSKTFIDSITLGVLYIISYIVLGMIINPIGRKTILFLILVSAGVCGMALHWIEEPILLLICFCLFIMLPGLCVSLLSGTVVDLIPTHLRAMAVCLCLMMGRFGSVVGSNIVGAFLETNCSLTFFLFSGFIMICGFLTLLIPN